jgi:hypothetical protein
MTTFVSDMFAEMIWWNDLKAAPGVSSTVMHARDAQYYDMFAVNQQTPICTNPTCDNTTAHLR